MILRKKFKLSGKPLKCKKKINFFFCSLNILDLNVTLDSLKRNEEKCLFLKVNAKLHQEVYSLIQEICVIQYFAELKNNWNEFEREKKWYDFFLQKLK